MQEPAPLESFSRSLDIHRWIHSVNNLQKCDLAGTTALWLLPGPSRQGGRNLCTLWITLPTGEVPRLYSGSG